jgi:hypothetical protein
MRKDKMQNNKKIGLPFYFLSFYFSIFLFSNFYLVIEIVCFNSAFGAESVILPDAFWIIV